MYDAIIIGAGMSGLAAGIRLAYYDRPVCILERHTTIGGLNSFYRLNGRDYDVGLHAVTNYATRGTRRGPLPQLLRQLRMSWDVFDLSPQLGSQIAFPGTTLDFSNDIELLESQIREIFPDEIDNFQRLKRDIPDYAELDDGRFAASARAFVSGIIRDPLLVEMIFCPLMYYGSARERDMDFGQFAIMFRSIFLEGFARPYRGVRLVLRNLVKRFRKLGGELRLRSGVRRVLVKGDNAVGVELDDGTQLTGKKILSSAGAAETAQLCPTDAKREMPELGQLSFVEVIASLDCQPRELGASHTIVFFNDHEDFVWEKPKAIVDPRSGVICVPNNFAYPSPLPEGTLRVTCLANYDQWANLGEQEYRLAKQAWFDKIVSSASRFVPDFGSNIIAKDMFTPTTVRRFTGHDNGAVYGSPKKQLDGATHLKNLFLCGTDQGFVGIVGAIVSGISMANRYVLPDT